MPAPAEVARDLRFLLLGGVCVAPFLLLTVLNARLQQPAAFFASLAAHGLVFLAGGARFERWRTHLLGRPVPPPPHRQARRTAGYAAVDLVGGTACFLVVAGWLVLLVRNVLLYPLPGVGEWGHSYPDPSWGGPAWQGAVALHTGAALASVLVLPWVLRALAGAQTAVIRRLLGPARDTPPAGTGQG